MKRFTKIAVSMMLVAVLATTVHAVSDVAGTAHNLSTTGTPEYKSDETQICIFCHTPHGGSITGPLWNRNDLTGSFTMYSSSTASATVITAAGTNAVNQESMLCLACHDGSISVYEMINYSTIGQPTNAGATSSNVGIQNQFAYYSPNVGGGSLDVAGVGSFGGQLGDDHPISFSYNGVLGDYISTGKAGDLHDVINLPSEIRLFGTGNRVECSTCHNPHEATLPSFLVMSNAGSALCLGCHHK